MFAECFHTHDTNVCFGVVSRIAYAAWPNCDSSPRVLVTLSRRGGKCVVLWRGMLGPWDMLVVCHEITMWMLFSASCIRVSRASPPDVLLSQVTGADDLGEGYGGVRLSGLPREDLICD